MSNVIFLGCPTSSSMLERLESSEARVSTSYFIRALEVYFAPFWSHLLAYEVQKPNGINGTLNHKVLLKDCITVQKAVNNSTHGIITLLSHYACMKVSKGMPNPHDGPYEHSFKCNGDIRLLLVQYSTLHTFPEQTLNKKNDPHKALQFICKLDNSAVWCEPQT